MMNRMSFSETIFLFFLALVVFGPKKLPEIARQVGKFMNEFRRASNEFKAQIEQEIAHLEVEKHTILPPSLPVEGTTSRTLDAAEAPLNAESGASLAVSNDEPSSSPVENGQETGAAEAVPATDAETVTSTTSSSSSPSGSQESHA